MRARARHFGKADDDSAVAGAVGVEYFPGERAARERASVALEQIRIHRERGQLHRGLAVQRRKRDENVRGGGILRVRGGDEKRKEEKREREKREARNGKRKAKHCGHLNWDGGEGQVRVDDCWKCNSLSRRLDCSKSSCFKPSLACLTFSCFFGLIRQYDSVEDSDVQDT